MSTATGERISSLYGFVVASVSFGAFVFLGVLVRLLGVPPRIASKDEWKWRNILVSWIHSVVVGSSCVYSLCTYPEMMADLIDFRNYFSYTVVAASTGYFIADAVDIISWRQVRAMKDVLVHHVAVLSVFVYNLVECRYIGYTIVALVVEVNSIFLHVRKLLQLLDVGFDQRLYRLVCALNLVTFVVCRFLFSLGLITYGLVAYSQRMSTLYYWTLATTMFVMWIVNGVLFWRLLCNDLLRRRRHSAPSSSAAAARDRQLGSSSWFTVLANDQCGFHTSSSSSSSMSRTVASSCTNNNSNGQAAHRSDRPYKTE